MKFIECTQGDEAWFLARAGLCTASEFATAISVMTRNSGERKIGDPTAASDRYACDIAIEQISGKPYGEPPKAWILERGHILEAEARRKYEARTGAYVTESGICIVGEGFGASTDGLVNDDGIIEVKCPIDSSKIVAMFLTGDVSEYICQIQGCLWITGRKWCDFIMHAPDLEAVGTDLYVKRILRDDDFIDDMVVKLASFIGRVQYFKSILSTK